jgi:hypothetical protein
VTIRHVVRQSNSLFITRFARVVTNDYFHTKYNEKVGNPTLVTPSFWMPESRSQQRAPMPITFYRFAILARMQSGNPYWRRQTHIHEHMARRQPLTPGQVFQVLETASHFFAVESIAVKTAPTKCPLRLTVFSAILRFLFALRSAYVCAAT